MVEWYTRLGIVGGFVSFACMVFVMACIVVLLFQRVNTYRKKQKMLKSIADDWERFQHETS